MRINLNPSSTLELERSSSAAAAPKPGHTSTSSAVAQSDDVAELSTGSDAVKTFKTMLNSVPDVRQQRIDELRQSIAQGNYQISPGRIANAMVAGD